MAATPDADAAAALARGLCDAPGDAAEVGAEARLAVGWALKAECYAAWSSDPPRALRAAQALGLLSRAGGPAALAALADWTEGIACLVRSRMDDAVAALDRAAGRWRAAGEPLHAAQTQVPKIMALAVLGRFDDAMACALATDAALRAGGDEHAAAKVRLNLGSLAFSRDEHGPAVEHYRAAAVRFARLGDREHSVMADIGLADALSYLGRFDAAQRSYARARMRADTHGLPVLAASADHGLALLALARGRYREALAGLEAACRAYAALGLEHRRTEAEKNLADAYLEVRLLPEAIARYTELIAALRADAALATLPWAQVQLARACALAGQPQAALQALADAATGFDAQGNAAGSATVQAVHAALLAAAGEAQAARRLAQQARDGFAAAGLGSHAQAAQLQVAAARVRCGEPAAALVACEALRAEPTLPPPLQVRVQEVRAEALSALGQRDAARDALDAAIDGVEQLRALLPGEELRRAFLADAGPAYTQRLGMALEDAGSGPAGAGAVLQWLERFKARALQERLGGAAEGGDRDAPPDPVRERLDWIYRCLQRQLEDDGETRAALRDEATRLERELHEDARRRRLKHAEPGAGIAPIDRLDVAALQRALGAGRALVEYGVVGDELFAIVVHEAGIRLHRHVASWAATQAAIEGMRLQVASMRAAHALAPASLAQLAERAQRRLAQLHALVWQPLAADLAGIRRLVIVPHGGLHGVPFAALGEAHAALVDRHELVMAASAAVALRSLAAAADTGAPGAAWLFGDDAALAFVSTELHAVQAALGGAQLLLGDAARVAALREAAARADVLHLACHARFRADSPLFSALQLVDGNLTAGEVQDLRLRARLVVLSACETALGAPGAADEGVGLVRAFLMAGAARVLGSHWAVDDTSTAAFMAHFYRGWCGGAGVAEALGQAQRALRAEWPHPAHWAAFALHGAG